MELVLIIIVIVYSIWSEVNKQKQEKDLDFDFSDLASIEEFVKKDNYAASHSPAPKPEKKSRRQKKNRNRESANEFALQATHDESHVNYDKLPPRPDVNYDEMPVLTGRDRQPVQTADARLGAEVQNISRHIPRIDRNNLVQAFIMSEVMQRYDINRIYERIPGIRDDNN